MLASKLPEKSKSTVVKNETTNPDEHKPKNNPRSLAMRLFNRDRKHKSSKPKSTRSSMISDSTSTSSSTAPRSRTHPYSTLPTPVSPRVVESVSVWNAAGQDITTLPMSRQQANTSTSNLSTTSTLLDLPPSANPPLPHDRPAPRPPIHQSSDSYEAFISRAQEAEIRRNERDAIMAHAWMKAEERRRASRSWPNDPWRGGFGPPSSSVGYGTGRRDGGARALNPRRVPSGDDGVRGWLGRNGLVSR
ncbi:hypothetical protein EG329_011964 [Mollisiaceae sp. DMI_Dod_QoI]|nr:hypothetical protein EG329_011964 [Helotiales sp. DMI_Dod_QoI]